MLFGVKRLIRPDWTFRDKESTQYLIYTDFCIKENPSRFKRFTNKQYCLFSALVFILASNKTKNTFSLKILF